MLQTPRPRGIPTAPSRERPEVSYRRLPRRATHAAGAVETTAERGQGSKLESSDRVFGPTDEHCDFRMRKACEEAEHDDIPLDRGQRANGIADRGAVRHELRHVT